MREGLILNLKSNSSDILRWDMGVMFARSYVLQLSDNIKRSKEQAAKRGIWMGLAPTGYMHGVNEKGEKTIIPDPDRAPFVLRLFEMYATGNHSLQTLKEAAIKMGLRTKKGEPLAISQINKILKKPFYCGMMDTKYGVVEHAYETLISKDLFQQVQNVINGYHKTPHKIAIKPFVFKGLITCANCGCVVTPEIQKKRYIYYSCTNAKKICKRMYVKEEKLVEILSGYLDQIALSQKQIEAVTKYLKEIHETESHFHTESLSSLQRERDKIQKRLSQIYDDKLDGVIDEKLYLEKVREYKTRQFEIADEMKNHEKADQNFYVTANMVLNLAARAKEIFLSSEVDEKRQLLSLVFQNLQLRGVNLSVSVQEPFLTMLDCKDHPMSWRWRESNSRPWQTPYQ